MSNINFIIMTKFEKENLKNRILRLATLRGTGTPADLATRLGFSERSIKRIIRELRDEGNEIRYCQTRGTYVLDRNY